MELCDSFDPMISVSKAEVPAYLHSGEFFQSLSDEDDEQISVPSNTLKMDTKIGNNADLGHLLSSLRFWGVGDISKDVVEHCLSSTGSGKGAEHILNLFKKDFPYVNTLAQMISANDAIRLKLAAQAGLLELVRHVPLQKKLPIFGAYVAAKYGHLHILQYLHTHGAELDSFVFDSALNGGQGLPCIQYLHEQGLPWPPSTLSRTLLTGCKECFHYALQHGCTWDNTGEDADLARTDEVPYVEALRYAVQHGYPMLQAQTTVAATIGALATLRVLHEAQCPWSEDTCMYAASNGHTDCLRYLHESGCPWDSRTMTEAISKGFAECVQYVHQHDCPMPEDSCSLAAMAGSVPILQYLHENGVPWDEDVCFEAARNEHLECLQYAHEHGGSWDADTCTHASALGHLQCLKYAHENGCEWNAQTTQVAAIHGELSCLQYAHEHGCEWGEEVSAAAAEAGQVLCLQYAVENGCPVTIDAFQRATAQGRHECIKYLQAHDPELFR